MITAELDQAVISYPRQTLIFTLYTAINLLTGFLTIVGQDTNLRPVRNPEVLNKLQTIVRVLSSIHQYVVDCHWWFDCLLQVIYYGGQLVGLCLLLYLLQSWGLLYASKN